MAIITAIYSFSLRLSLTPPRPPPPPPPPPYPSVCSLLPLPLPPPSFTLLPFPVPRSLVPTLRASWCTGLARVRPSGCQRVVEPPSSPPLIPLLTGVFKAPRLIAVCECNTAWSVTAARRQNSGALFPSPSVSLLTSIVPLSPPPAERTLARISATGADSRGRRDTDEVAASAIRLPLAEYECTETDGQCASATGVYVRVHAPHCALYVSACVIGCVAIVNEIVRSYAGGTRGSCSSGDDWSSWATANRDRPFHRYSKWKVERNESENGNLGSFSTARQISSHLFH